MKLATISGGGIDLITKEQLADWLETKPRKERMVRLERYIDSKIKKQAMKGNTTFSISTMKYNSAMYNHRKTDFYDVWYNEDLSLDNQAEIKRSVIEKYRDNGFNVEVLDKKTSQGERRYEFIRFIEIHKMLDQ